MTSLASKIFLNETLRGKFSKVKKCLDQKTKEVFAMKIMDKVKLKRILVSKNKKAYDSVQTEIAILKKLVS